MTRQLKQTMTKGNLTEWELKDVLFGRGGGSNEQYDKLKVLVGGQQLNLSARVPGSPLPDGDAVLVWEHTSQSCALDKTMLAKALDSHAYGKAQDAADEAESEPPYTTYDRHDREAL